MVSAEAALGQQREEAPGVGGGEVDAERITVKESVEVSQPGCVAAAGMDIPGRSQEPLRGGAWGSQ